MNNTLCLDEKYSTTRLIVNGECLMMNEQEKNSTSKIDNSTLFLLEGEGRKDEVV
jgi:hypothetical protein